MQKVNTTQHIIINGDCRKMSEVDDNINGAKQDKYLAMFPEELPKRLIRMFSFPEETVLDPFMGSGTTASVARRLGRNSIGYEINPVFIPLIENKIGGSTLVDTANIVHIKQTQTFEFDKEIATLPYKFEDVHQIDKKIDVKKLKFGSKIDQTDAEGKNTMYSVREVISPELIQLNNVLIVRMIGIKQNPSVNGKASEFLISKFKGRKVFLKFDQVKYDSDNHPMVYMYLDNRTFINAHLLKQKLALVDDSYQYKYREKIENL